MWRKNFGLLAKGFCIGSVDVVPGVSGGTMAFILGIYQDLINAIKSFDTSWLKSCVGLDFKEVLTKPHFSFLIPLGIGIVLALIFFTRIIPLPVLIQTHPVAIYSLFFGLIIGSILFLVRRFNVLIILKQIIFLISGLAFGAFVVTLVPASTPNDSWFIFLCGVLAISAMMLPGISGSFILLMMKKYAYIFNAIGHFQLSILLPFITGVIIGLIFFSRLLSFLLKNFYQQTMMFITGLLIASLYVIWPFQQRQYEMIRNKERLIDSMPYIPTEWSNDVSYAVIMMIMGFLLVVIFEWLAGKSSNVTE
ncbi:MAG: DUF368 domain-containing protein [Pseudomonadota bacterium]